MAEERQSDLDRERILNNELDSVRERILSLENSVPEDFKAMTVFEVFTSELDLEQKEVVALARKKDDIVNLRSEESKLETEIRSLSGKCTMKTWIHQPLPTIEYFDSNNSGGSSYLYGQYWPLDLKKWADFNANVRDHVCELVRDTGYSRYSDDFSGWSHFNKPTHANIRQRFTDILKGFSKYEPFKECTLELSVSDGVGAQPFTESLPALGLTRSTTSGQLSVSEGATAQPSTESLGPTQIPRSTGSGSTEVDAAKRRANKIADSERRSPDISVKNGEKNYILVVEAKKPNRIRRKEGASKPDLESPTTDVLKEMIGQVTRYMVLTRVGYAILTSLDLTYFFKIQGRSMLVSEGLVLHSPDIPLLGAIHYILKSAIDIVNVNFNNYGSSTGPPKLKRQKKSPAGTGSSTTQQQDACDVSANCHLCAVSCPLKEINVVDLNLCEEDYAFGSNGPVALGRIGDTSVILKIAHMGSSKAVELHHEVHVYLSLAILWGQSIPSLVDYGSTDNGTLVYLAIEYIAGPRLDAAVVSEEVVRAARNALGAIHSLGVLHGDLHEGNILVGEKGVRIIDFGRAKYTVDWSEQEREMSHLEKILQEYVTHELQREILE